jgi:hypothetical protein
MDGTTDYSTFSDAELALAKARVDAVLSPLDHENVRIESARRRRLRWGARAPTVLKVVGALLIAGAVTGCLGLRFVFLPPARIFFPLMILPLALWAVAGVCLLMSKPVGATLGIAALGLQLVSFAVGGVDYVFSPLASVRLMWSDGNFIVNLQAGAHGYLRFGQDVPTRIALDLVAVAGIALLAKSRRSPAIDNA